LPAPKHLRLVVFPSECHALKSEIGRVVTFPTLSREHADSISCCATPNGWSNRG
jgi:hypothetical protein